MINANVPSPTPQTGFDSNALLYPELTLSTTTFKRFSPFLRGIALQRPHHNRYPMTKSGERWESKSQTPSPPPLRHRAAARVNAIMVGGESNYEG